MDVNPQAGGARSTRRRRGGKGTRRRAEDEQVGGGGTDIGVEKADAIVPAPTPVGKELAPIAAPTTMQMIGGAQKVVIAPPKKKPAKLMLVPKQKTTSGTAAAMKKTFKAKRVRVVIDNTAKTQKRRRQVLGRIDGLSEAQIREAAVTAKLAKAETVKKVPISLLRQMMRDYQTLRGNLL